MLVNIYAPVGEHERERFYAGFRGLIPEFDGPIFVVGNFNCMLHPVFDHSRMAGASGMTR